MDWCQQLAPRGKIDFLSAYEQQEEECGTPGWPCRMEHGFEARPLEIEWVFDAANRHASDETLTTTAAENRPDRKLTMELPKRAKRCGLDSRAG